MVIVTSHGSEYVLGKHDPSERFTERCLMEFLPERKLVPPARLEGVQTQVLSYARGRQTRSVSVLARSTDKNEAKAATILQGA